MDTPPLGARAVAHTPTAAERTYLQAIGRAIWTARCRRGLTRLDTADTAQLSRQKLGNIERGDVTLTVLDLRAIAAALQTPASALLPPEEGGAPCPSA